MTQSGYPLNREIYMAITNNLQSFKDHFEKFQNLKTENEKIKLQSQTLNDEKSSTENEKLLFNDEIEKL